MDETPDCHETPSVRRRLASPNQRHSIRCGRRARDALRSENNLRRRVLAPAMERANEGLVKQGAEPLPEGVSPHSLRRTFANLLYAVGEAPPFVMEQMGHTTPGLALSTYAKVMRRGEEEAERSPRLSAIGQQRATTRRSPTTAMLPGRESPHENPHRQAESAQSRRPDSNR